MHKMRLEILFVRQRVNMNLMGDSDHNLGGWFRYKIDHISSG